MVSLLLVAVFASLGVYAELNTKALFGIWIIEDHKADSVFYGKQDNLSADKAGIVFMEGGALIKRQFSGGCATPPISYENYPGTWKQTSDSTIALSYEFWDALLEEEWSITDLSEDDFQAKRISIRVKRDTEREDKRARMLGFNSREDMERILQARRELNTSTSKAAVKQ